MTQTKTLDLDAVLSFSLVASLASFTRAAEALETTQSAVSLKMKRLESFLGRQLIERTPRSVRLTVEGTAFLEHAKALLEANRRALTLAGAPKRRLRLGVSDHAVGTELPTLLSRLYAADPGLELEVRIGFSHLLVEAFNKGEFDGVIVQRDRSHRQGEILTEDQFAWFAAPGFQLPSGGSLMVANLAAPCSMRAIATQALDKAGVQWREVFVGGGIGAVAAAIVAGLAVAALARRIAPLGAVDVGHKLGLPQLPRTKVVLMTRAADPPARAAFRTISAVMRGLAAAP
jgi:DNA-binding transcriptional LysR family regulator